MRIGIIAGEQPTAPVSIWNLVSKLRSKTRSRSADPETAACAPTIEDRQNQLISFYVAYEALIDTLCDAAQYGPNPGLSRAYERSRAWMQENYPPIRKFVVAYLDFTADDAALVRLHESEGSDAFEALIAAPSLESLLAHDDGLMISRLERTRHALTMYGEHLRQLAKA